MRYFSEIYSANIFTLYRFFTLPAPFYSYHSLLQVSISTLTGRFLNELTVKKSFLENLKNIINIKNYIHFKTEGYVHICEGVVLI